MIFAHLPAVSRNPMFALMLAGGLLLLQTPAAADVYKWVNENNEVQYTQMAPPAGIKFIRIQTSEHPEASATTSGDAAPSEETATDAPEKKTEADSLAEYEAEVARVSKENCTIAKNNLAQLNMGGHLRYKNEAGEYVTMTEEERQKRIGEANKQIEMFCKSDAK